MSHSPGFLRMVNEAKRKIKEISIADVRDKQQRGQKFFFVDIREDEEWAAGRAKGAMHIGKGVIERDIESLIPDKKAEIVLYCGGGFRSALSALSLQQMGYQNVFSMAGGIRDWRELGHPEEK
jgi:rhodanese-related sulfurtransferase